MEREAPGGTASPPDSPLTTRGLSWRLIIGIVGLLLGLVVGPMASDHTASRRPQSSMARHMTSHAAYGRALEAALGLHRTTARPGSQGQRGHENALHGGFLLDGVWRSTGRRTGSFRACLHGYTPAGSEMSA